MSSSSSFLEAHWSTTGIFRRLFFVSPHRAKEALKHRAVKDDDDDVAKSIEIMVEEKKSGSFCEG